MLIVFFGPIETVIQNAGEFPRIRELFSTIRVERAAVTATEKTNVSFVNAPTCARARDETFPREEEEKKFPSPFRRREYRGLSRGIIAQSDRAPALSERALVILPFGFHTERKVRVRSGNYETSSTWSRRIVE